MILCLDLETTGLNEQTCGLLQIGAVWLHSGEAFFRECSPPADSRIEKEALAVNGIEEAKLFDPAKLWESLAVVEFLGWVRGSQAVNSRVQIAAWNAHFDHRHLMAALSRARVPDCFRPFAHRLLDVHSILAADTIRLTIPRAPDEMLAHLGNCGGEVPNSDAASEILHLKAEAKPHNALAGAKHVRAMLRRLLGDSGALP